MSFHQNGNRRYGAVPPAQYASAQDQGQPLRRQSSFDDGDDAPFFEQSTNLRRGQAFGRTATTAQEELFVDQGQNVYQSAARGSYRPASPSVPSGYQQQQFQSFPAQPSHAQQSPATYNPQQFARTIPQSPQHSATYQGHTQPYSSTSRPGNIAPYNPALYQAQASLQNPPQSPQSPYNYNLPYASPTLPQSSNHWLSQDPLEPVYNSQAVSNIPPVPLPPKPAAYLPPPQAAPYAPNGSSYPSQHGRPSQSLRTSASSELPYLPMPTPLTQQNEAGFPSPGLQRHPTLRPLPSAPVEEDLPTEGWDQTGNFQTAEELHQERLFQDINSNLHQYSSRQSGSHQEYGSNVLDGELHRWNSGATTLHPASNVEGTMYDDDSDPEAAAGLQAMLIADQQDAIRESGALFDPQDESSLPTTMLDHDASSDSDYAHANMDMGLYSGGYDGHISYGASNFHQSSQDHRDEMSDQSTPLPASHGIHRLEEYHSSLGLGGTVSFQELHEAGSELPGRNRAYSYDDGDERSSVPSRRDDSRLSGRPGSSSPDKEDYGDFFYGPGPNVSGVRPLPALPTDVETVYNNTPGPRPRYQSTRDSQYDWHSEATQQYFTPSGYDQLTGPTGQYIPRSASHISSSTHPRAMPPIRAKTDAEERQAAKHNRISRHLPLTRAAGSLDGYDFGTAVPPDLPTLPAGGRRKKFNPTKLSSKDFEKCLEPWALSSVARWLREMCGGETDSVDSDLRKTTLTEGLVNLFKHKVPRMDITDAEILSEYVVNSMFEAGLLIHDEEWVKLGVGEISGVLWQLTGSGCYSPRLHKKEITGRCYSRHCSRTSKILSSSLQPSEAHSQESWEEFYKITEEQKKGKSNKELQRQNVLHEIYTGELTFQHQLYVLQAIYRDSLLSSEPPVITPTRLRKVVEAVYGRVAAIDDANKQHLLPQLEYKRKLEGPWISGYAKEFREWIRKARPAYVDYATGLPNAKYEVKKEMSRNVLFRNFLDSAQKHKHSNRLSWDSYLQAPTTRLQRYTLLLGVVLKTMTEDSEEKVTLEKAIEEIKSVTLECDNKVAEGVKVVELLELDDKLVVRPGLFEDLCLKDPQRRLLMRGDLLRAGRGGYSWIETHAVLYDHLLMLPKLVITGKDKKESYDISRPPIPMPLLVLEGAKDDPVMKLDLKIGAVTTSARSNTPAIAGAKSRQAPNGDRHHPLNHANTNSSTESGSALVPKTYITPNPEMDEKRLFPFRVKRLGAIEVYTLYATTSELRDKWCEHIMDAKTRYAASLHEQNAEPFGLKVIADSAFAYDDATAASNKDPGAPIRGTPLDRALREMQDTHGSERPPPVCRTAVNCATGFTAYSNKAMLAIGTDEGVYIGEVSHPRKWTRVLEGNQLRHVTQITVLEDFSLVLILANKSLIACHLDTVLDTVVPVSNYPPPPGNHSARRAPERWSSHANISFFVTAWMKDRTTVTYKRKKSNGDSEFKVLEPIHKSSEKKAKSFWRKPVDTDSHQLFDQFYIPGECYGLNIFKSSLAVSTIKGFEMLTLDSKISTTIPNANDKSFATISARLAGLKPLGMFRLHETEFLLIYEGIGVYVDNHGQISRSVILELVGKAKAAAMYEGYLLVFTDEFVEIRDSKSGRLRQIIVGKDVKCLDFGVEGKGAGGHRSVKISMCHPENPSIQLILELVLIDDSKEWKGESDFIASSGVSENQTFLIRRELLKANSAAQRKAAKREAEKNPFRR